MLQNFGKYHIQSELGKGGFATVYRAVDTTLDRAVALKVLDPLLMRDATWAERFRREAKTIAALKHPAIISIYEVNEVEGRLYLAMELAGGGSLAGAIAARGRLPWAETLALLKPVCEALDYAHGQGVIHRDLKPANILLTAGGQPLLTDFGFARLLGDNSMSLSLSGGILGTPAYIAPEVWELDAADAPADIYALGCIVYEVLTGEVLFQSKTPMQAVRAHDQGPQYPVTWPEGTPGGLVAALNKALARDPGARYPSATTFWHALNALEAQAESARQAAQLAAVAAQWRAETETAMRAGEWGAVKMMVGRWLKAAPEDKDALKAQQQVEAVMMEQARKQQEAEQARRQLAAEQERQRQVAAQLAAEVSQRRAETKAAMQASEWDAAKIAVGRWLKVAPGDKDALQAQQQIEAAVADQARKQQRPEVFHREDIPLRPLPTIAKIGNNARSSIPVWVWGIGVLLLIGMMFGGGWLLRGAYTPPSPAPIATTTTITQSAAIPIATSAATSTPTATPTTAPTSTSTATATPRPTDTPTAMSEPTAEIPIDSIVGQVRWNDQPLEGIFVELIKGDCFGDTVDETTTDSFGNYYFYTVATPGEYTIGTNGYTKGTRDPLFESSCYSWPFSIGTGEISQQDRDITKKDLVVTSPKEGETTDRVPSFYWRDYENASYYGVYVFRRTPDFEQVFLDERTYNTYLTSPKELGSGTYDGWVIAYNSNGTAIANSNIPEFSVK